MQQARENQGLVASNLRVKVTMDPKNTQSGWLILPGQIGFKRKDGSYHNEWVDVWCSPQSPAQSMGIGRGTVAYVWGRFTMDEQEYNGQTRKKLSIWADQVEIGQQQPQQSPRQSQQQRRNEFPTSSAGMDAMPGGDNSDVPF